MLVVTALIIVVNIGVFVLELLRGDAFVLQWSAIPAQIVSGHHWITILTAMFMHGSWSHIIGNMIFLWAFAPEIEDAMCRGRYLAFYLIGGLAAMLAQVLADPHSTVPNLGANANSSVDFSNVGGTLSGTNSGLSLSGSTLTTVNGLNGGTHHRKLRKCQLQYGSSVERLLVHGWHFSWRRFFYGHR